MAINQGEKVELIAKLMLIYWRDNQMNGIKTVGFGKVMYRSHNLTVEAIKKLETPELINVAERCGAGKAPSAEKADVYINGQGYSLKYSKAALPALINHTHRAGILKVCEREKIEIKRLDALVDEYWKLREGGRIGEDVHFKGSVFEKDRDVMVRLLAYFLFKGTARGNSNNPAVGLYKIEEPYNFVKWKMFEARDAAESIIDQTVVSIRSKAMPETYSANSYAKDHVEMRPWVRHIAGAYRGTLHVRG